MNELIKEIVDFFSFLYARDNCKFVDSTYFDGGGVVIFESDKVRIKFVRERGQTFVDIGPVFKPDIFFNLFWIRKLLNENPGVSENSHAESQAEFLKSRIKDVEALMSSASFEGVKIKLNDLRRKYEDDRRLSGI